MPTDEMIRFGNFESTALVIGTRDKTMKANATLDRQIDNLVYELYELTPDEIAIVEGSGQ